MQRATLIPVLAALAGACASTGEAPSAPVAVPDIGMCREPAGDRPGQPAPDPSCGPEGTPARVELVSHLSGCRAGLRGAVTFLLGGQALATLRPGERATVELPRGDVELTLREGEKSETRALSLAGSGPVRVEVGCDTTAFVHLGLQPLVLEGPRGACGGAATVKVRAGGLDLEVAPGQAQTLFLPRGSHIVKVGGVDRTVELGEGGSIVPLTCGTAGP